MYYLDMIGMESVEDFSASGILYNSGGDVVKNIFDTGKSLKELKEEKFTIIVDEEAANTKGAVRDKISAFVQDAGAVFILSDKGCQFLKDHGVANLELFDLTIKGKNVNLKTHKLVNVVSDKINCINTERSEITYGRSGNIKEVEYLELMEEKIPESTYMFLIGGFYAAKIFVRPEIKEKIKKSLSGFKFDSVEEFVQI